MKKKVLVGVAKAMVMVVTILICFAPDAMKYYYYKVTSSIEISSTDLPDKNQLIYDYVEKNGHTLAPTYQKTVCTEYLIKTLEPFYNLSELEKNRIRIITNQNLDSLLENRSDIIKGVQYALTKSGVGEKVESLEDAKAGDLIQFWNTFLGKSIGHCGVIRGYNKDKGLISLYSSSPKTNGHGVQLYMLPDQYYIVRLK